MQPHRPQKLFPATVWYVPVRFSSIKLSPFDCSAAHLETTIEDQGKVCGWKLAALP
jgi:hypothetical protein